MNINTGFEELSPHVWCPEWWQAIPQQAGWDSWSPGQKRDMKRKKIERHRYWGFLSETATKSWASKSVVEQIRSRSFAHAAAETLDVLVAEEIETDHT